MATTPNNARELAEKVREALCTEWQDAGGSLQSAAVYGRLLEEGVEVPGYQMSAILNSFKVGGANNGSTTPPARGGRSRARGPADNERAFGPVPLFLTLHRSASCLEDVFSETHIQHPAWIGLTEATEALLGHYGGECRPQHVVGPNKNTGSWRLPASTYEHSRKPSIRYSSFVTPHSSTPIEGNGPAGAKGYPMWPCSRSRLSLAYSFEKANSPSGKR